jgi:acetyl-CoA acyltransferase
VGARPHHGVGRPGRASGPQAHRIGVARSGGVADPVLATAQHVLGANRTSDRLGKRLGWPELDLLEIHEAFAAQVLACTRELGLEDNDERINPNGGAISLGHPLGMSGTRILQTAAIELQKQKKRYALVTMCIGVGQGYAVILERV